MSFQGLFRSYQVLAIVLTLLVVLLPIHPQQVSATTADGFDYPLDGYNWKVDYDVTNPQLTRKSTCYDQPMSNLWHAGEDWAKPAGTVVKAVGAGVVRFVADPNYSYPGRVVIIEHTLSDGSTVYSMYGHINIASGIVPGKSVGKGDAIGTIYYQEKGNSHLHWEIRYFFDGSGITNAQGDSCSGIPGPGYTYPGHPDNFSFGNQIYRWTNPSAFIESHRQPSLSYSAIFTDHDSTPSTMAPGETKSFNFGVKNTGTATWNKSGSNPVHLSYHWYDSRGNIVIWDGLRTGLPKDVAAGEGSGTFTATIQAPSTPGTYTIKYDMVKEEVTWFSWLGSPMLVRQVTVSTSPPYSSGEVVLNFSQGVDLDQGKKYTPENSPSGNPWNHSDLFWLRGDPHVLEAGSGVWETQHLTSFGRVDFDRLTLEDLRKASYGKSFFYANELPSGTVLGVITNEGRYTKVQIKSSQQELSLKWVTY